MLLISAFFFLANIHTAMATKEKIWCQVYKGHFGGEKNSQKLQYFEGKKKSELSIF
jgi:hypothetical protein